tara:strand:- start:389 stop:616 length:228 start_codon:yes stop_codon:yes gene_type:complete
MRIPDEKQIFEQGDTALYREKIPVTIDRILTQNVYYEHRPIASYKEYLYSTVSKDGTRRLVEASDLSKSKDGFEK